MVDIAMQDPVTVEKTSAVSVRPSDTCYLELFEHMQEGIAHCQMLYEHGVACDFIYLDVNEAFSVSTGLTDVVGRKISDVLPAFCDSNAELLELYARVARTGASEKIESFVLGVDKWLSISVYSLQRGQFAAVFSDITKRKSAERDLVESRRRFREIAETITEVFWVTDSDFSKTQYVSPAYEKVWGRSCESLYANPRSFMDAIHVEDRERVLGELRAMPDGKPFGIEYRLVQPGGSMRWIWDRGFPVKSDDGRVTHYVGVAVDITDRKLAEQRLSDSECRFRALVEGASEPVAVMGREGVISYVSPAMKSISGYEASEFIGKNLAQFVHPQDAQKLASGLAMLIDEPGKTHRNLARYLHKDGSWISLESSARNLLDEPSINGIVVNLRNVTDRVRAEAELAHNLTILKTQQETSLDGILVVDACACVISQNQRFLELWHVPQHLRGEKEDEGLRAYIAAMVVDPEAFDARVAYLYAHPDERSNEEIALKDGRIFDRYSAPMRGSDEDYIGRVWFFHDITEYKRAEKRLRRVNRALKTLSACDSALIHATTEASLYSTMCKVLVDVGGYCMAWVGRADSDARKSVRPVAFAGDERGYLQTADISWDDGERSRGATGSCIRSGALQIMRLADVLAGPWRTEAAQRGYAAIIAMPLRDDKGVFGSITIHATQVDAFDEEEVKLLSQMAEHLSFGVSVLRARIDNESNLRRVGQTLESTVHAIAGTVETRDPYTAGHQRRVATLCVAIARKLGLPEMRIRGLDLAATIHDLGKISIPAEILNKPGRLSSIEMQLVKTHAEIGYEIIKDIDFPWPIAEMVRQHHERLDGSGYPRGLKGDEILLEARIIAVADVVDAMSSHRPYRPGLGLEAALQEIARQRGITLDADVVDACLGLFREGAFDPVSWSSAGTDVTAHASK